MIPAVMAVSFLGADFLGIAALGAPSMRTAKVLAGSALALLASEALVV